MIEIHSCPSDLSEGFDTYSPAARRKLFGGKKVSPILDFGIDNFRQREEIIGAVNRISVSGVQEKFPSVIKGGRICLAAEGERATHILKPVPWDETISTRRQIPANENLTMQIASQVYGIRTAANGLCFSPSGDIIYITKRFDLREDGSRIAQEDFASLTGRDEATRGVNYKYDGCYADIADAIRRYIPAWRVAMEEFFRIVTFNYIYGNGDAHLKNFSIVKSGEDYLLSPAYDLLNTAIHIDGDDFALSGGLSPVLEKSDIYEKTGHPCREDFESFGRLIGLNDKRIAAVLNPFATLPESATLLMSNSFLNEKMKRSYLRTVKTRIQRFCRGNCSL